MFEYDSTKVNLVVLRVRAMKETPCLIRGYHKSEMVWSAAGCLDAHTVMDSSLAIRELLQLPGVVHKLPFLCLKRVVFQSSQQHPSGRLLGVSSSFWTYSFADYIYQDHIH